MSLAASGRSGGWRWPRPGEDGTPDTLHPLGGSEPSDPFPVVGINQRKTPYKRLLGRPSQGRSAPSRRPAAPRCLLRRRPPVISPVARHRQAAGCSCSLLEPPSKGQNDEQCSWTKQKFRLQNINTQPQLSKREKCSVPTFDNVCTMLKRA